MKALLFSLALSAARPDVGTATLPFMRNKAAQRQELLETLKRNIQKVDHSMAITEDLIAHSKAAPYLPDLEFRLAELYVEKSRYIYFLQAEQNPNTGASLVAPEVRLIKQKALSIYARVLREFPDFHDADKVRFYTAHEYRELGQFDEMLKMEQQLVDRNPKSPLATEALLIMGDYFFEKSDLTKAEGYYTQILKRPPTPATDLANFKMGWVKVNQANHNDAVKYFEAAAIGIDISGPDAEKRLNVRRESLSDLVYSYTEVKPAKGAPAYFGNLSDSSQTYLFVLDKLANRYYIKQEYESAIPALRKLLANSRDPDRDDERADKLYEALRAMHGKLTPVAGDVKALVRVAERLFSDPRSTPEQRKRAGEDFEVYCRDLATQIQVAAQQASDKKLHSEAADAYAAYLSLFRVEKWRYVMEKNHAVSLLAADRFVEAGEQYEALAKELADKPDREELLYTAVGAFAQALRANLPLTHFEQQEARSAVQQLGAEYVKAFAKNARAAEVEFNVARAYYDEGEYKKAAEGFVTFAADHPDHKDAPVAVSLTLDCYHQLIDFEGMEKAGKAFLAQATLPDSIKAQVKNTLERARNEQLDELALKSGQTSGDAAQGLVDLAKEKKGTELGEKALHTAFATYREKRDGARLKEIGEQLLADYPNSTAGADVLATLGKVGLESADFEGAAARYEELYARFPKDGTAIAALQTAAETREQLGDYNKAIEDLNKLAADPGYKRRGELQFHIADLKFKSGDQAGAQAGAEEALRADPGNGKAAALVGRVLLAQGKTAEVQSRLNALTKPILKAARGSTSEADAAAEVFFLLGEAYFKEFSSLGAKDLEKKANEVGTLEQIYTSAARLGSGTWAVGGLYRLGLAYQQLANDVKATPVPAGADPAQVKQLLDQQSQAVQAKADEFFGACVRKARDLEVYNAYALGCAQKAQVDESVASAGASGTADPGKVQTAREALSKNPNDLQALEDLGTAYLAAGDTRRAKLTFLRYTQVDGTKAIAYVGVGEALMRMGEFTDAHDALAKATDLDPGNDLAHADMAALRCRFGDPEGAKAELQKAKPTDSPLLDPDWQKCK